MKKIIVILILLSVFQGPLYADEADNFTKTTDILFKTLSLEDGLSNGTVYTLGQDSRGVMWFGTDDKLNMYDGYDFTHYRHDPYKANSVASNSASNIFIDRNDYVWIGTWGAGLDKYDYQRDEFTHYKHNPLDNSSISDDRVQTVFQDTSGTIWAGTFSGGLNKLDESSGSFVRYKHEPNNPSSISNNRIWGIVEDSQNNLVIATSDGLNYFNTRTGVFEHFKNDPEDPSSIASSRTRVVHNNEDGKIWVGTSNGISLFDPQNRTFENYTPDLETFNLTRATVNEILLDKSGRLWVGFNDGLLEFNIAEKRFVNAYQRDHQNINSLTNNNVRALYQDSSGLIWVGTRGGGVSTFNPSITFYSIRSNTDYIEVDSLMVTPTKDIWIGQPNGLYKYASSSGQTTSLVTSKANSIIQSDNGTVWAGFDGGAIYKFDQSAPTGKKLSSIFPDNSYHVKSLLVDGDTLWIGTHGNGLYLVDTISELVVAVFTLDAKDASSISGNEIWSLFKDSEENFWIGTENGISLYDKTTHEFLTYKTDFVYDIYEDHNNYIWLGSRSGLHRLNENAHTVSSTSQLSGISYNQEHGLLSNMIYSIQGDKHNNLWLSTEYGISKYEQATSNFKNYNRKNGLVGEKYKPRASSKSVDGELFFGGTTGITSFYPDNINESDKIPSIIFTRIEINDQAINMGKSLDTLDAINLTYEDIIFSFRFSALNFIDSQSNQYAYMLEGFDREWIYAGKRNFARYTNIKPGAYTFKVKAANSYDVWNETGISIRVLITPPWWDTIEIKVISFTLITLVLVGAYYLRVRSLTKQNLMLELKVNERTKELAHLNAELIKLASIDGLTQLTNRRYGDIHLQSEWKRAIREQTDLALIFIDIDYFKLYNDYYGHPEGDVCLKYFGNLLSSSLKRSSDLACRYGGEEFLLILPNTSLDGAITVAQQIQYNLETLGLPHVTSPISDVVTCSMGITSLVPHNELEIETALKIIDDALYNAKEQGRNQFVVGN